MIPRDAKTQRRHLERLEASVLTEMLVHVGQCQSALAEKGLGSGKVENLALLAVEHGRTKAPSFMASRPSLSEADEWDARQWDAVDEAEAKFAGVINHIVALRDGAEEEEA